MSTADPNPVSTPRTANGSQEPYVVPTNQLAPIIDHWAKRYEIQHPQSMRPIPMGAIAWLAHHTGIAQRALLRIRSGESQHTGMSRADAILQAIDDGHRLDQDVDVIDNPRWSRAAREKYNRRGRR